MAAVAIAVPILVGAIPEAKPARASPSASVRQFALGERRFVAVVEFERARFLVGGTTSSLVLLARLGNGQAWDGKDAKPEQGQGQERNEKKDNQKDGITATDQAATEVSGSVQS